MARACVTALIFGACAGIAIAATAGAVLTWMDRKHDPARRPAAAWTDGT